MFVARTIEIDLHCSLTIIDALSIENATGKSTSRVKVTLWIFFNKSFHVDTQNSCMCQRCPRFPYNFLFASNSCRVQMKFSVGPENSFDFIQKFSY